MWIVCLGSKRSGSTLQYNLISRIVEISGVGVRVPYTKTEDLHYVAEKYKGDHFKVIKTHQMNDSLQEFLKDSKHLIVYCFRDIRDVLVSYVNQGWIKKETESLLRVTKEYIENDEKIKNYLPGIITRKYEDFVNDILSEAVYFSKYLNIDLSDSELNLISEELSINNLIQKQEDLKLEDFEVVGNHSFDRITLLHKNHINNGSAGQYNSFFSVKDIISIEQIAWCWLIKEGYSLTWPSSGKFLSASQHGDDYLAYQLFSNRNTGVVIEVGAFDGLHLSNSFSLSCLGWDSVCVEPNPIIFQKLKKQRPESQSVNAAVVSSEDVKEIDFYAEETGVLSGCNYDEKDVKLRHERRGLNYKKPDVISVPALTLDKILQKSHLEGSFIDIISIDVEGFELEVLQGLRLKKWNVGLFIVEANTLEDKEKILHFFTSFSDYIFLGENYQNLFIVNKSIVTKKVLRRLKNEGYFALKQYHPNGSYLTIDSIKSNFKFSSIGIKNKRLFKLF